MGYGEYGGGGSVHWKVVHGGNGGVSSGRDPVPKREPNGQINGKFVIMVDGVQLGPDIPINGRHDQIQIYWTPHTPGAHADLDQVIQALNDRTAATTATEAS